MLFSIMREEDKENGKVHGGNFCGPYSLENGSVVQSTLDITQKGCFAIAPPAKSKHFYLM